MRKDRTPEEIRAGWAKNLSGGPPADKPRQRVHITPEEPKSALGLKLLGALAVVGGLIGWLATHGWRLF